MFSVILTPPKLQIFRIQLYIVVWGLKLLHKFLRVHVDRALAKLLEGEFSRATVVFPFNYATQGLHDADVTGMPFAAQKADEFGADSL